MTSHEGQPGKPGQDAAGGTGGVGGAGGIGGEPGGTGGEGGEGGSVYIDSRRVARWVRTVWIGFVALGIAMAFSVYLVVNEHGDRISDNTRLEKNNMVVIAAHRLEDRQDIQQSIVADCDNARQLRQILLRNGYFNTSRGRRDLVDLVRHGSRAGCTLNP